MERTIEELYLEIGKELSTGQEYGFPLTPSQYIERGKKWFESKYNEIQEIVCQSEKVQSFHNDKENKNTVITAIADLIAPIYIHISPFTVALLVMNFGLANFCKKHWSKDK